KNNPNDFLYNAEDLLSLKNKIAVHFDEIFQKDLKKHFKDELKSSTKGLIKNTLNIGLGFVPFSNIFSGLIGAINDGKSFIFNLSQGFKNQKSITNYDNYINAKEKELNKSISKFDMNSGTGMIDIVRLLTETISKKMTI
ncbi:MAG: hypothetical protein U9Q83_06430, partial [Bacteroidota bacterium]|nr:hypothetical protein [Bacteroidota bacterium]